MQALTRTLHLAFALSLSFAPALYAQESVTTTIEPILDPETVEAILDEGLANSQVMDHLDGLTNSIGHRLTGSDNFTLATRWARDRFAAMGYDNAHLEPWATWPVTWNRGQWSGRIVEPRALELQVATEAWTAGTKGRVQGPLVLAPRTAEDAAARAEEFRGAWIWTDEGVLEVTRRGAQRPEWLDEFAKSAGIAGFVRATRGDQTYPTRIRVFGNAPQTQDFEIPTVPDLVVRSDQAETIDELLASGQEVVAEFDIRNRFRREPIELNNVVAEIPGTEFPDEVVIVCAHLDSWHQATGTTDNGTGSATTLEAARILRAIGAEPKRTIRFCLWGGEEQGLLGSREYVRQHRDEMGKVSFVFNHDTGTNWWQNLTIDDRNFDLMARVVAPFYAMPLPDPAFEGEVFDLREVPALSGGGGSDHASFLAAGVPAASIGLEGRSDYFGYTWHTQWDTYDVAIPEYQRHTATKLALAALGTANLPELLSHEGVVTRRQAGRQLIPALEGLLGLKVEAVGEGDDEKLFFRQVAADGRGHALGLRSDDRLVDVVGRGASLRTLWYIRRYEQEFKMTVERDGEQVEILLPAGWGKREDSNDDDEKTGGGDSGGR
jgi:carboxypeptidase Q